MGGVSLLGFEFSRNFGYFKICGKTTGQEDKNLTSKAWIWLESEFFVFSLAP